MTGRQADQMCSQNQHLGARISAAVLDNTGGSPSALRGAVWTVGGGLASAFKPLLRLRQGPPSGMVLLIVADVLRLSQVIHAGLATRDPTYHPPPGT